MFRGNLIGFCADIAKMYRQIWVTEEQRPFQRILWREQPIDKVQSYNINTITFGLASSPFLAVRCLKQLAEQFSEIYPEDDKKMIFTLMIYYLGQVRYQEVFNCVRKIHIF